MNQDEMKRISAKKGSTNIINTRSSVLNNKVSQERHSIMHGQSSL